MSHRVQSWMTDEYAELHDMAVEFADTEVTPCVDRWREQHYMDREFWLEAGKQGLLCRSVPAEYGGGDGSIVHDLVVLDAFVRAGLAPPSVQAHNVAANYVARYGTFEQRARWLSRMASGRLIGALAITEPDAGSDIQSLLTGAVRDGDEYVLDGRKTFITNGSCADLVIVAVSTDPTLRGKGISLFVVETASCSGFTVDRKLKKIGQHDSDTAELKFEQAQVHASGRLGDEGDGFAILKNELPQERLLVAGTATAAIEHAVELTTRYVNQRIAFGAPLIHQQHVRFELAECASHAHVARVFLNNCVHRFLDDDLDDVTVSMAKWWFSDLEGQVIDRCLQLFGGYGYMDEYPIAHLYTAARAQRIYGGANAIMKEMIGRTLVDG